MTKTSEIGKLGEDLACEYLVQKKWKILQRNFRKPWGELDIIAKDPNKVLVFVEVKTMRQFGNGSANSPQDDSASTSAMSSVPNGSSQNAAIQPEDNLTATKLKKLQRTASLYVGHHPELINEKRGWRIDLVAITLKGDKSFVKHFENI